ncbi:LysO family transporter [Fusibacter tunisiensis]|jgi:uncharacterized membrane protein YbjE (DUF340 family)|uniref:Uncharacterized membrane protein YbjE (DUF340 family) n=1 Tax=Fusibacter tunisiensis TaxID=1008308 RepID=A0ABS2MRM7_9FIRM|nr:LysO family transporter [Fusibacter tunisiensis]MBM7562057.1 uncharacterized membrane protein YbjE (DUF340 family) [Fusibacter tunisiensis]
MSSILLYLILLLAGGFLSYKGLVPKKLYHRLDVVQMICLFALLFTMGLRIGMDDAVIGAFAEIGMHATLYAVFTVAGSIIFVYMFRKGWMRMRGGKKA